MPCAVIALPRSRMCPRHFCLVFSLVSRPCLLCRSHMQAWTQTQHKLARVGRWALAPPRTKRSHCHFTDPLSEPNTSTSWVRKCLAALDIVDQCSNVDSNSTDVRHYHPLHWCTQAVKLDIDIQISICKRAPKIIINYGVDRNSNKI